MTFLSPAFLIGIAAAAVPLVLHLLRREPEPHVRFAPVRLLKRAQVEQADTRRLRELLLLLLRVAALVLLAVAFARPFLAAGALGSNGVTMIALDTSFSLSAPGVFERARRLALEAIDRAPSSDAVGVVTFADQPVVAARPSSDRAIARAAIRGANAGVGATRYRAALEAAAEASEGRRGTLVVVTDLQASGWDAGERASIPDSTSVEVADVGPMLPNLAVTALRTSGSRILASVANEGSQAREARVRLMLDGRLAGERRLALGEGTSEVEFPLDRKATTASVEVEDPQGIAVDNVRYAILSEAGAAVWVVTSTGELDRDAFYVHQALLASAGAPHREVKGVSAKGLSELDVTRAAPSAVLLLSTRGLERRGRQALAGYTRAGGGVLVAAGPDIDAAVVADVLGSDAPLDIRDDSGHEPVALALVPVDLRHPLFKGLEPGAPSLGAMTFWRVARIQGRGCQAIARFTAGRAALLDCTAGEGRGVVFASDLNGAWNDFGRRAAFLPFLQELVDYLAGARFRTGSYVVADVPPGVPAKPGFAILRDAAATRTKSMSGTLAINVDPRESRSRRLSLDEFRAAIASVKSREPSETVRQVREREDSQHLWQYAIALMIGLLAIESFMTRGVRGAK